MLDAVIAVGLTHHFASRRDRKNKQRIDYLVWAYRAPVRESSPATTEPDAPAPTTM